MKKILIIFACVGCICFTGCNTSKVHISDDEQWYIQQIEKEKRDPSKTIHNCPYCRCLKRDAVSTPVQETQK